MMESTYRQECTRSQIPCCAGRLQPTMSNAVGFVEFERRGELHLCMAFLQWSFNVVKFPEDLNRGGKMVRVMLTSTHRRWMIVLVLTLVSATAQMVSADGEVTWYWKNVNVSGFSYPTTSTHTSDKFMNTSEAPQGDTSYTVTLGAGERAWWYTKYPAEYDVPFPQGKWTTTFWVNATNLTDNEKTITVKVHGIYANGSDCWVRYTSPKTSNAGSIEKIETKPSSNWPSYTVPEGGRIAAEVLWYSNANGSLIIYYGSTTYNSSLTSPPDSPVYPVPELPTLTLFSVGLLIIAGCAYMGRRAE